jgi:hypothetical protein
MSYRKSLAFQGDPAAALDAARVVLIGQDFAVSEPRAGQLIALRPWMTGSRRSLLRGISSLEIEVTRSTMTITAGRRNVVAMILFVLLFPPVLALVLGVTQGRVSACLQAAAPWFVVSPILSLWLWYRTKWALERLVGNLLQVGNLPR